MRYKILFLILPIVFLIPLVYFLIGTSNQPISSNRVKTSAVSQTIDDAPFSDTPLYSDVVKNISREIITVPINVYRINDSNLKYSTNRSEEDIRSIVREMNKIWSQADIVLEIKKFQKVEIKSSNDTSVQELIRLLKKSKNYTEEIINIYFTRTLDGINGIAFPEDSITIVADYTSVNDYRASSHEVGHVLGLSHTDNSVNRLMFRGVNGTDLTTQEILVSRTKAVKTFDEDDQLDEIELPEKVLLDAPFTSQAPFGEWSDPKQDYGCEEASSLMVWHWIEDSPLSKAQAKEEIIAMSDWQLIAYGDHHDSSSIDTIKFFTKYFDYKKVGHRYDITVDDIREELARGNLIIVPVNGKLLDNPYFTPPGPLQHMIVIKGYDDTEKEFITNDPGTSRGDSIRYSYDNIEASLQDYVTGWNEPIEEVRSAMIIIEKEKI